VRCISILPVSHLIFFSAKPRHHMIKVSFDDYHLPEDDNHHSHRRGNLKSYKVSFISVCLHVTKKSLVL
jgi:hypothetical protein